MFKAKQLNFRISLAIFIFALLWGILFLRSAYLQLLPHKKLTTLQNKLFDRTVKLKPRRGVIYDRHNKELAISIPSFSLFADPQKIDTPYYAAKKLSQLLNKPQKPLLKRLLNKKRRFVWLKRHLSEPEIKQIKSWRLKGLYFVKESKRFYSQNNSLSQVLGFTGVEGQGLEGIEKQYDKILKGSEQKLLIQRDAKGRPLFRDFTPFVSQVSGFDVHLTIDSHLQIYLEKGLKKAVANSQAESAMGIILSAKTSEILALSNIPNYDPHQPNKKPLLNRRNRVITDMFEPGSTLKTFTLISALKKGFPLTKTYASHEGKIKIGNYVIQEAELKKKFKAQLNFSEILALSSNVGSAQMALDVGAKSLRKTLFDFGFGKKTGLRFPGEAKGLLRPLPWRPVETATTGFGHGIASTALQIVNAYTAIANGGFLKSPLLVKKIRNPYTGEEKHFKSQHIKRVLSQKEAETLTLLLISVTEGQGTGLKASVPGYLVAGKTGTAQKVDLKNKGYKQGEYISSFAGFIPANKPKFVIYLVVDGAKDNFYASSLVAPLFSQVASYSVRSAGLSPTVLEEKNMILTPQFRQIAGNNLSSQKQLKNNKKTVDLNAGKNTNPKKQLKHKTQGESDFLTDLKTQENFSSVRQEALNTMPYLKGLTLREVLQKTKGQGLKLKIKGRGRLSESLPQEGLPLPKNKQVTLIFK